MNNSDLRLIDFGCRSVRGICLTVSPGRTIGLTGPSGSGKTVLLRALADLEPYDGQLLLGNQSAAQIPAHQWRRSVGLLPAESVWWHDTVGEHFDHEPPSGLKALGFEYRVMAWQINHLSSGERQRLSLLRLLRNQPRVLLLDEPTANLDLDNTHRAEAFIARYRSDQQAAVIWVSHDPEQLKRCCDEIFVLEQRRLRAADQ